jgi:hypothetical protein
VSRSSYSARTAAVAALLALAIAGCGGGSKRPAVFKTSGKITYRNQPAGGAFVVLHPKHSACPDAPRPTAHVRPDGTFEATTFDTADGAPAGEYVVTVQWRKLVKQNGEWTPGADLIPARYASPQTSDLTIRIAAGDNNLPPITLR